MPDNSIAEVSKPPTVLPIRRQGGMRLAKCSQKGPHRRLSCNQVHPGTAKIHCGRKTHHKPNGPITVGTLKVRRDAKNLKDCDTVFLATWDRPTDQQRLMDAMTTAMDDHMVNVNGHVFHHSAVVAALDAHADIACNMAMAAVSRRRLSKQVTQI